MARQGKTPVAVHLDTRREGNRGFNENVQSDLGVPEPAVVVA